MGRTSPRCGESRHARHELDEEVVEVQEREQSRRLRSVHALEPVSLPGPRSEETAASILPAAPRVGGLDALLREVDDLRLTLETDLTLAAAAVEAGGTGTAIEIIARDIASLHEFEDSALHHLAGLEQPAAPRGRAWGRFARLSAAPFVAAAAVVGLLLGVVPNGASPAAHTDLTSVSAQSSLQQLTSFAAQGRTSEVRVAALQLHDRISALVDTSPDNPVAAQQALLLLSYERSVIVQSGDSAALHDVLVLSAALAAKIRSALPFSLRTAVPAVPPLRPVVVAPAPPRSQQTKPKPAASPSPTTHASPSPKPTPSPSATPSRQASATPSPSASAQPTAGTPFVSGGDPETWGTLH